jgi:glycosyltransferase involved in cell wall biosynthesis
MLINNNTISIVIPCRNEENYIANCLESILDCNYPNELIEVKVVDGMSDDNTRDIIQKYSDKYEFINIIDNKKQKTPYAFNLGIKNNSSDFVIFMGARFEISKNYIQYSIDKLQSDDKLGCIGGAIYNNYENNISETISKAMNSSFGIGVGNFRTNFNDEVYVDTVSCAVYRMNIFNEIGLFDERLTRNQDDDFNYRVKKAGYNILSSSKISYKYMVRASFPKLFKQYYQYGYWKVLVNKKHKTVTTIRQLVPFGFVSYIFLFLTSFGFLSDYVYITSIPLVLYILLISYFSFKLSDKLSETINLFKSFFILHFSYGLGYLEGIFNFILLNRDSANSNNEKLSR